MRVLIMGILLSLSSGGYAFSTQKITNTRSLFQEEKERLRETLIPATIFLLPALFLTREWHDYRQCKKTLEYLEAAYILKRDKKTNILVYRKKFSDRERRHAKRKIDKLLKRIHTKAGAGLKKLMRIKDELEKEQKNELTFLKRIVSMKRRELVRLLEKGDELLPRIFGNKESGYARADTENLVRAFTQLDNKKSSKSIYEVGLKAAERQ